jgi:hypothetical protein
MVYVHAVRHFPRFRNSLPEVLVYALVINDVIPLTRSPAARYSSFNTTLRAFVMFSPHLSTGLSGDRATQP